MASSKSVRKGQIPIGCQLCETGQSINCKCTVCDLLLCNTCSQHHLKMKITKDHKIIDLKEVGHYEQQLEFSNIACENHSGQNCCLFCKPCETLVCPICIAKKHNRHDLIEINEAYEIKKEELQEESKQTEKDLASMTSKKEQLNNIRKRETTKLGKIHEDIKNHGQVIKEEVDKSTTQLLLKLKATENNLFESIKEDEESIAKYVSQAELKQRKVDELMSIDASKFFKMMEEIKKFKLLSPPSTKASYDSIGDFISNEFFNLYIGYLEEIALEGAERKDFEISQVEEFTTGLEKVSFMLPGKTNRLWVCSSEEKKLILLNLEKETDNKIFSHSGMTICGMAAVSKNEILLSLVEPKLFTLNKNNGKVNSFPAVDLSPLRASALHVTKENELILGAVSQNYPKPGKRAVIVMSLDGKKEETYENDKKNKPIFAYPRRITSTANGNIHVGDFDFKNEKTGKIIILGPKGDVINEYMGNGDMDDINAPFGPSALVTTPSDNVIVANLYTHTLHILDNIGQLLTLYRTRDIGIHWPYSFAVLDRDIMYIGCSPQDKKKCRDAILYKVKISGQLF